MKNSNPTGFTKQRAHRCKPGPPWCVGLSELAIVSVSLCPTGKGGNQIGSWKCSEVSRLCMGRTRTSQSLLPLSHRVRSTARYGENLCTMDHMLLPSTML